MNTVEIVKFDGGHAEDLRTPNTDECEKSLNFDIFTNPHKLIPYTDSIAETLASGSMANIQIADVDISLVSGVYYMTGVGFDVAGNSRTAFSIKLGGALTDVWTEQAVVAASTYIKGSGVIYKDQFYALRWNGSNTWTLDRYNSAGSVTQIGTITYTIPTAPRPFVHPIDNVLYIIIGTTIASWDGATFTVTTTILPVGMNPTSMTDYGIYLAIAMTPLRGNGNSIVYLWGRDATINTLQGSVDFGEGNLLILENLNNSLIAIFQPQNSFSSIITNKIIVREYSGGAVQTLKSIIVGATDFITTLKLKNANKLYFGSQNADDCMYVVGKNKEGNYIITKDRFFDNGTMTNGGLKALSMIGDIVWRGINSTYKLMRSTTTFVAVSIYKTTINPSMIISDRYKRKQLNAVQVSFTGKSGGTIQVKYSVDGSTMTSLIPAGSGGTTTLATEDIREMINESDGTAFLSGREFQFQIESTGGVEIKELKYRYSDLNTNI